MENLCLVRKQQMVYFFAVGRNLAVIFSVHRMIVVILKLPLLYVEKFGHSSTKTSRAQEAG